MFAERSLPAAKTKLRVTYGVVIVKHVDHLQYLINS